MKAALRSFVALAVLLTVVQLSTAPAYSADNWLLGTWSADSGYTYTFGADKVSASGSAGSMDMAVTYAVDGDTVTATMTDPNATQAPLKCTKNDDTHATCTTGSQTIKLTKS
ncbi:MAG TPA: hypothetical protein VK760_00285 [Candidatus Acidoferrales bacterium]|jgi:hypothetical protein|nr:hypothetical protein [Candidatus Acidoferrales bacterium]